MEELHVKNYGEYLKRLKESFSDAKQMPSNEKVHCFISKYNLDSDWKILIVEVKQDILFQILNSKTTANKQKRILSYKEYLIKLKDAFGIPKVMQEDSKIKDFISEFALEKNWGITVKDVSEDLEKFISGKYDELYRDAIYEPKPKSSVQKPVRQSDTYVPPVQKTVSGSRLTGPPKNLLKKSSVSKSVKEHGQKKEEPELQKTIFIDGDNHIDVGQKGIECTSKDIEVRAFFSQSGAKEKFDKKYGDRPNVSSKLVSPGSQAVDNQIKTEAGRLLKKENQDVVFVSYDSDFKEYADKKNNKSQNRISVVKSVGEALKSR